MACAGIVFYGAGGKVRATKAASGIGDCFCIDIDAVRIPAEIESGFNSIAVIATDVEKTLAAILAHILCDAFVCSPDFGLFLAACHVIAVQALKTGRA